MKQGLFITFEGTDGAGKTTQIMRLQAYLSDRGHDTVLTREPGGTPISEKLRQIILDKEHAEMKAVTEALLYAAARAQHVAEVIRPALAAGKVVICDRFTDSSVAYQGFGRGLGQCVEDINAVATGMLKPDRTFLLQLSPAQGKSRIAEEARDRLEQEKLDFYEKVCGGYAALAEKEPQRITVIDATRTIDEIAAVIRREIDQLLQ